MLMGPDFPVILFYKYVSIEDPAAFMAEQRELCTQLGLKGRLLIATEGINGTLAGTRAAVEKYIAALRRDPRFADIAFDWWLRERNANLAESGERGDNSGEGCSTPSPL